MPLFVINFTVAHLSLGGSSLLKGMVNSPHLAGELNHFATFFYTFPVNRLQQLA